MSASGNKLQLVNDDVHELEKLQAKVQNQIDKFHRPFNQLFSHLLVGNFFFVESFFISYIREYFNDLAINEVLPNYPLLKLFVSKKEELKVLGWNFSGKNPPVSKDSVLGKKLLEAQRLDAMISAIDRDSFTKAADMKYIELTDKHAAKLENYKLGLAFLVDAALYFYPRALLKKSSLGLLGFLPKYKQIQKEHSGMTLSHALTPYQDMSQVTMRDLSYRKKFLSTLQTTLDETNKTMRKIAGIILIFAIMLYAYLCSANTKENSRSTFFTLFCSLSYGLIVSTIFPGGVNLASKTVGFINQELLTRNVNKALPFLNEIAAFFKQSKWKLNLSVEPTIQLDLLQISQHPKFFGISKKTLAESLSYGFTENGFEAKESLDGESIILNARMPLTLNQELTRKIIDDTEKYIQFMQEKREEKISLPDSKSPLSSHRLSLDLYNLFSPSKLKKKKTSVGVTDDKKKIVPDKKSKLGEFKVNDAQIKKFLESKSYTGKFYELNSTRLWPSRSHFAVLTVPEKDLLPQELKKCQTHLENGVYGHDIVRCDPSEEFRVNNSWTPALYKTHSIKAFGDLRVYCFEDWKFTTPEKEEVHIFNFSYRPAKGHI